MDNIIFRRRSIRRFLDKHVEPEKVEKILRAGMQAPSAHNNQRWEFIVVTDREKRENLSTFGQYTGMIAQAPVAVIILGKYDNEELNRWFPQDLGACTENILLQIVDENLAGCWMGFYPKEDMVAKVKQYFEIPENIMPFGVVAIGYSEDKNIFVDRFDSSKIHYNKY